MENSRYHKFTWEDLNVFVTFLGHIFLDHMLWNAVTQCVTSQSVTLVKLKSQMAFEPNEVRSVAPNLALIGLLSVISGKILIENLNRNRAKIFFK